MGYHDQQRVQLFLHDGVNCHHHIRLERIRLLETVGVIKEGGIFLQRGDIRHEERYCHHVSSVLDEYTRVPVIWMVIVRSMAHDDVCLPLANELGDGAAVLESRQQFAIVDIHDIAMNAEKLVRFLDLIFAPQR